MQQHTSSSLLRLVARAAAGVQGGSATSARTAAAQHTAGTPAAASCPPARALSHHTASSSHASPPPLPAAREGRGAPGPAPPLLPRWGLPAHAAQLQHVAGIKVVVNVRNNNVDAAYGRLNRHCTCAGAALGSQAARSPPRRPFAAPRLPRKRGPRPPHRLNHPPPLPLSLRPPPPNAPQRQRAVHRAAAPGVPGDQPRGGVQGQARGVQQAHGRADPGAPALDRQAPPHVKRRAPACVRPLPPRRADAGARCPLGCP